MANRDFFIYQGNVKHIYFPFVLVSHKKVFGGKFISFLYCEPVVIMASQCGYICWWYRRILWLPTQTQPNITNLQSNLNNKVQALLKKWRNKVNQTESTLVSFTLCRETVHHWNWQLPFKQLPLVVNTKYIGIHLDVG